MSSSETRFQASAVV